MLDWSSTRCRIEHGDFRRIFAAFMDLFDFDFIELIGEEPEAIGDVGQAFRD